MNQSPASPPHRCCPLFCSATNHGTAPTLAQPRPAAAGEPALPGPIRPSLGAGRSEAGGFIIPPCTSPAPPPFRKAAHALPPPPPAATPEEKYQRHNLDYGVSVEVPASWVIVVKQGAGHNTPVTEEKVLLVASSSARPAQASITISVSETNPITQSDSATLAEIQEVLGENSFSHISGGVFPASDMWFNGRGPESVGIVSDLRAYTFTYEFLNLFDVPFEATLVLVPMPEYTISIGFFCDENVDVFEKIIDRIKNSIKIIGVN